MPNKNICCGIRQKKIEAGTYRQTKKPGDSTSHKSFTDRCFLPDLTGLGDVLLRGTWLCGAKRDRTADLCIANAALSQLSYSPLFNNQ